MTETQYYKKPSRKALNVIVCALADRIESYAKCRASDDTDKQYWTDAISEAESAVEEIGEMELLNELLKGRVPA